MWRRMVWYKFTDVSLERIARIFRLEDWTEKDLVTHWSYSSTSIMKAVLWFEMSVHFHQTTRRDIPQDGQFFIYSTLEGLYVLI
jgi:hypothetical protein